MDRKIYKVCHLLTDVASVCVMYSQMCNLLTDVENVGVIY